MQGVPQGGSPWTPSLPLPWTDSYSLLSAPGVVCAGCRSVGGVIQKWLSACRPNHISISGPLLREGMLPWLHQFQPFPCPETSQRAAGCSQFPLGHQRKIKDQPSPMDLCLPGGLPPCLPAPKSSTDSVDGCFKGGRGFSDSLDIPGAGAVG